MRQFGKVYVGKFDTRNSPDGLSKSLKKLADLQEVFSKYSLQLKHWGKSNEMYL